ncbi:hypothetical protein ES703_27858 [subsurface metagenome]
MILRGYIDEGIKKETVYLKGIKRSIILKIEAYGKNHLFVYLVDPKGKLRGQYSYFNEKRGGKIFLSEKTGSIGTNPGGLPAGDWHLFITTFDLIEGSNDKMEYEIEIEQDYETSLDSIDTIEICCDPTWKTAEEKNKLAMKALDLLWDDGHKIYGIGGSDSHLSPNEKYENATRPSIYGDPSTYVYCVGLCGSEILRGLKRGRIYVARDVALDFIIRGKKNLYFPGDRVNPENISYKVKISNLKEAVKVCLIENGQIKDSVKVDRDTEVEFKLDWNEEGYNWARIDMRNMEDNFVSYINPIYKGEKEPSIKTWRDLLIAMEDSSTTF